MKKRIMLLIAFGVSFAPPVLAFEPSRAPIESARLGENSVLETTASAINCKFADLEKSVDQDKSEARVKSISANSAE
ncbi:hypothetical protein WDW86_01975 [Bdellovibrionota bacterium FG-2]